MIWFACKQCGKTHGRPETAIGATIFCDCGVGLIVPWESAVAEPPAAVAELPQELKLEPVTFDPAPAKPAPLSPLPSTRGRKRVRPGVRDPKYCFNHQETPRQAACADCGEGFCDGCMVSFQDADLCGPCKNYRVKNLQRHAPPSNLSILSMLSAFLICPVTLGLLLASASRSLGWSLAAFACQGLVAWLGVLALREAEKEPRATGRALALTGLISAGVTAFLIFLLMMYTPRTWM